MNIKLKLLGATAAVAALGIVGVSVAAVTFDQDTGTGFVGKGDVQLVFGWNNSQLQSNAGSVQFRTSSEEVSETKWTCDRDAGPQTQERTRTTTTTFQGIVAGVARVKNQVTGFNLNGYSGTPTQSSTSEGPAPGSCPTGWSVVAGPDTEVISSTGGGLEVSSNGTDWYPIG